MADASYFHNKKAYATEQITVTSGAAVTLTTAKVDNSASYPDFKAMGAVMECRGFAIYYTLDGTTPSSTNGIKLSADQFLVIAGYQKLKSFKAIAATSDATLNVQ